MKRIGLLALVLLLTTFTAGSALAQQGTAPDWANKNGAVGLGFNTTLGGTHGLIFRTYVSPLFGLQGTLGFNFTTIDIDPSADVDNDDFTVKTSLFAVGIYATYKIAYWQRGSLSILFGGDIQAASSSIDAFGSDNDVDDSTTNVLLGIGLQAEWFPTQYLSLFGQGGLRMDFLGNDDVNSFCSQAGVDCGDVEASGFDISLPVDLMGAAGIVVWFK